MPIGDYAMTAIARHGKKYFSIIGRDIKPPAAAGSFGAICSQFFCNIVGEAACCAACPQFMPCDFACLNSPDVCGLCLKRQED